MYKTPQPVTEHLLLMEPFSTGLHDMPGLGLNLPARMIRISTESDSQFIYKHGQFSVYTNKHREGVILCQASQQQKASSVYFPS